MENIRLSRNELLQQARKVKVIKDEIDKILKETTNTYQILGRISEVSTFLAKRDLDNVRNTANKVSREFENLCLNINNAVKTYDQKEKEINKLAQIKKNQIVTNTISKNQYISNVYSIGKNIQFKINSKRNLGSLIKTKSILKVDTKNIISTVGVGKEIPIDIVLNITLVKSKDILLNIGKTISKLSNFDIKNISGVKPVKDKIIKPIIEVSNIYDKLIGKAVKYSKEIVSIVEDKAKSQLEKVKEKVNEVWDSISDTIESLKKKVIGKGKELLDDFKGLVNNLKEGLLDFFKISKKIIIGIIGAKISYMMAAYNTITQALIGIIAGVGYLGGMIFGVSPSENSFSKWVETWRGGVSNFFKWLAPNDTIYKNSNSILDMVISFIPVVGDVRDLVETITGVNMITGEKLSPLERIINSKYTDEFIQFISKYTDEFIIYLIKKGIISADELLKIGIKSVDDLAKLGIKSVDNLVTLGVKNVDDLSKIGIESIDDLTKLGIDASELKKIGIDIESLKGASKTGVGKTGEGIPMEEVNPDVLNQIHADDNGAYGYMPNEGTVYDNPKYDFTDVDWAKDMQNVRKNYLEASKQLEIDIERMTSEGFSKEDIAKHVVDARNQQKVTARANMTVEERVGLEARNIELYGNSIGPDSQWLFNKTKKKLIKEGTYINDEEIWDIVIKKSMKKDDVINTLLGLKH